MPISKLTQSREDGKNDLVYYFFKAGPFMGNSYLKLRLNLVLNKFRSKEKSGSLIRVSTPIVNGLESEVEKELLSRFINDLSPHIEKLII